MIPPGKCYYFFSFGGENGVPAIAKDHQYSCKLPFPKRLKNMKVVEFDCEKNKEVSYETSYDVKSLNYTLGGQTTVIKPNFELEEF